MSDCVECRQKGQEVCGVGASLGASVGVSAATWTMPRSVQISMNMAADVPMPEWGIRLLIKPLLNTARQSTQRIQQAQRIAKFMAAKSTTCGLGEAQNLLAK